MGRWLITGSTGLLGANAMLELGERHDVTGSARRAPSAGGRFLATDISDPLSRHGLVERSDSEVVLHSAAIATIEGCEADPELAHEVNVRASEDLAAQAYAAGAQFIFVSTDAVFDGVTGGYTETDPTSPISEYGRGKVEAEERVLAAHPGALVARVNFYGWSPSGLRSLAEYFHARLSTGLTAGGFTDVTVSTTYVRPLLQAIEGLVAAGASGIFHVVSPDATTKFDFGRMLAEAWGYDPGLVTPALSTEVLAARRGANLSLSAAKLDEVLGHPIPGLRSSLHRLHSDEQTGWRERVADYQPIEEI